MRKIALLFLLLISSVLVAQDTPIVAGVKFGTDIETAYKILVDRYGEEKILYNGMPKKGNAELLVLVAYLSGLRFDCAKFEFQVYRINATPIISYLSSVFAIKNYSEYKSAKRFYDEWDKRLARKYGFDHQCTDEFLGKQRIIKYYGMHCKDENLCAVGLSIYCSEDESGNPEWGVALQYIDVDYVAKKEEMVDDF